MAMAGGRPQPQPQPSPHTRHAEQKAITISFPGASAADDAKLVSTLVDIVNTVYHEAEEGIFIPGYQRTTSDEVAKLLRARQLAVAYLAATGEPIGCALVKLLSSTRGDFGMLALDAQHRGGGFGTQLTRFAEDYCRGQGCTVMQLELLVPTSFNHAFKERNQAWYLRMGYKIVKLGRFEDEYPALAPLLAGPAEFRIFEKSLV